MKESDNSVPTFDRGDPAKEYIDVPGGLEDDASGEECAPEVTDIRSTQLWDEAAILEVAPDSSGPGYEMTDTEPLSERASFIGGGFGGISTLEVMLESDDGKGVFAAE